MAVTCHLEVKGEDSNPLLCDLLKAIVGINNKAKTYCLFPS